MHILVMGTPGNILRRSKTTGTSTAIVHFLRKFFVSTEGAVEFFWAFYTETAYHVIFLKIP